jgi:hypothetical protein
MNRNDFLSGKEAPRPADPQIVPNQIWNCLEKMDFKDGRGDQEFSIIIRWFNPITQKWVCAFHGNAGNGAIFNALSSFELTVEEINKKFQFHAMWAPTPGFYQPVTPINPQQQWNNPFQDWNTYNTNNTAGNINATGPMANLAANVSGTFVMGNMAGVGYAGGMRVGYANGALAADPFVTAPTQEQANELAYFPFD